MSLATLNQRNYVICLLNSANNVNLDNTVKGVWYASTPTVTSGDMSKFVQKVRSMMTAAEIKSAGRKFYTVKSDMVDMTLVEMNRPVKKNSPKIMAQPVTSGSSKMSRSERALLKAGEAPKSIYAGIANQH